MKVALDLDGTLITAKERQSLLLKAVAGRYGIQVCADDAWAMKREGHSNLFVLGKYGVTATMIARIDSAWQSEIESPYWLDMDSVFVDTNSCLHALNMAGCEVYILTARRNEYLLRHQLHKLNIGKNVSRVVCVSPFEAVRQKHHTLGQMRPSCVIGDSETDFEAAALADVKFCGVTTGQRSERFLRALGAPDVCQSLTDAVKHVLGS
jgi:phosphoglycolate phosphatase-like HAD superfamily hydrolase